MARLSTRQLVQELSNRFEPVIRDTFLEAVRNIRSEVVLKVIVERLEKGDVHGAIRAMQLDGEAFSRLELALFDAYNLGGQATVDNLPRVTDPQGNRVLFRFGVRNLEAESWLRDHSSQLVARIIDDQREGIRQALTEGLAQGRNPRSTALDVVGRVNRFTGQRDGGIIGLTAAQERFVSSARRELLSGDPGLLKHYLTRDRRDKRFDHAVIRSIQSGKPLDAETVSRMTGRYSDRLLLLRGEMLARTETMTALGKSRNDAIRQQIAAGKVEARDVEKFWRSAGDKRVRHTHQSLNGKSVGMDALFTSESGAVLRHPGDPDAPASEIIGCRCWCEYKIDFIGAAARRYRAEAAT